MSEHLPPEPPRPDADVWPLALTPPALRPVTVAALWTAAGWQAHFDPQPCPRCRERLQSALSANGEVLSALVGTLGDPRSPARRALVERWLSNTVRGCG